MDSKRQDELMQAVEALVFAADQPVKASQIARIIGEVAAEQAPEDKVIESVVARLNARYEAQGTALRIHFWAGGYRMATTEAVAPYLQAFFRGDRGRRLTRPLMETLAIICYRQPATKPEVDHIRGVNSDYALRRLLDYGLIAFAGRAEAIGRPILYATTDRFLEAFGLSDLGALPNLREVEALLGDPSFNQAQARMLMVNGLHDSEGEAL